ncbi:MAG: DNA helicase RecQ [Campylobacterota bacterium]|nr:DNA helicase RecQ [Campylobacterota bacterium]
MNQKYEVLNKVFGHSSFRSFQEEAVDAILAKKDLVTIIPTGAGKSLCYQLPAILSEGLTVVISPLIALMHDQVVGLRANNIKAAMINSSQTIEESNQVFDDIRAGEVKLLYVAPERFSAGGFIEFLSSIHISFFVIDEAHCVSEWGHEFRADYQKLSLLKQYFPTVPVAAFTATATQKVQANIITSLNLNNPVVLRGQTKRDNLTIKTKKRVGNGQAQLLEFLKGKENQTGIVYTFTRKETESVAKFLQEYGYTAKAYHAGLNADIRHTVYKEFLNDEINIVVATIAFGMGIDKSNIRFVAHTSMPKTLENYYQEIGRAGRDGLESETLLLYTKADEISRLSMMDDITNPEYKKLLEQKLNSMYRFANNSSCRHQTIAKYFDDEIAPCETKCDNCVKGEVESVEITTDARKFLSAVIRVNQSFGQNHIIEVLRGSKNKRIYQFSHENLSVYNIGSEKHKNEWDAIVDRLFDMEAITIGEHRAIKITPYGMEILKGQHQVFIDKDKMGVVQKEIKTTKSTKEYSQFFEDFRSLRTKIAQEDEVAPYIVFSDKVLVDLSEKLPQTKEEFLAINGIGDSKWKKYGERFLELTKEFKPTQKKKLTKTYLETLELVEEGKTIDEIAQTKGVQSATILAHIKLLQEHEQIVQSQVDELYAPLLENFPDSLKLWCEEGLKRFDIKTLKSHLNLYEQLFLKEEV